MESRVSKPIFHVVFQLDFYTVKAEWKTTEATAYTRCLKAHFNVQQRPEIEHLQVAQGSFITTRISHSTK